MSKNILDLVCESQDIDKSCSFRGDTYDDPSSHDQEWGGGGMNLLMMLTVITTVALLMIRMATEELV